MKSVLLSCSRLQGRHTGDNVVGEFEDIVCAKIKIIAVVTDNASNMKKGFSNLQENFPGFEDVLDTEESGNESEDDMEIEEELDKEENYDTSVVLLTLYSCVSVMESRVVDDCKLFWQRQAK